MSKKLNYNYQKGVRKERKIVNQARSENKIAFRSAGSHSPIDVCIIDQINKKIRFIQCKPDTMSESQKQKILYTLPPDDYYEVEFSVE